MARIAIFCPPYYSHVRLFEVLGEALSERGHDCHFILNAGAEMLVASEAIAVHTVAARRGDPSAASVLKNAERPAGILGALRTIADSARLTDQLCAGGPDVMRRLGIEAVLCDQLEPAGFLTAAHLGLPAVAIANALPINRAPGMPSPFLDWPFDPSPKGIRRAEGGDRVADWICRKHNRVIAAWATRWKLPPWRTLHDCLPAVQIAQVVEAFDFPRPAPSPVHAVGPIRRSEPLDAALPFTIDPGKPFVFASLGTVQGHRWRRFRAMSRAVHAAGGQIFVGHCGKLTERQQARIGADFTADFIPQRAALRQASLTICHAGMNTVLDSLEAGVPLLVRPIAFDQKGSTARLIHHRLGERMGRGQKALNAQVKRMLGDAALKQRLRAITGDFAVSGGTARAVELIEAAYGNSKLPSP